MFWAASHCVYSFLHLPKPLSGGGLGIVSTIPTSNRPPESLLINLLIPHTVCCAAWSSTSDKGQHLSKYPDKYHGFASHSVLKRYLISNPSRVVSRLHYPSRQQEFFQTLLSISLQLRSVLKASWCAPCLVITRISPAPRGPSEPTQSLTTSRSRVKSPWSFAVPSIV